MKTYNIHFIRHGACAESLRGEYVGTKDVELSDEGINEIKALDEQFIYPGTPVVFTSPLKRCIKTCELIYPAITPIVINELRECSFGEWEGRTADSLAGNEEFKKWLAGDTTVKPPKGESGAEFTKRICNMFASIVDGLIKTGTTTCVIVTHGGVIMTLLAVYGLPQAKPFEWAMESGCGYSMRIIPSLWMRDKVGEVYSRLPYEKKSDDERYDDFFYNDQ
ncbi:MAG: histidine phosphatase family protein [Acutalibacteraceae bacterium]|nr:histidine phosphatase family protein [Acutalibacteraceae bacterium]